MKTRTSAVGEPGRTRQAFTLVEILVVVAILALAAGVIIPRMGGSLETHELAQAAAGVAHTARTVHEVAVAQQKTYNLEFDLDRGAYAVTTASEESPGQPQAVRVSWLRGGRWSSKVKVTEFRSQDGGSASKGVQRITFLADGTSSGAMIRLACGARNCGLVVHPHNGRVVRLEANAGNPPSDQMDLGD